jgi:hypothetical protein
LDRSACGRFGAATDQLRRARRIVDSLSHGQLAYIYLPNTASGGYSNFNRDFLAQQDRKGVILDERYNGGGYIADYIIDFLQRNFDGYFNNAAGNHVGQARGASTIVMKKRDQEDTSPVRTRQGYSVGTRAVTAPLISS